MYSVASKIYVGMPTVPILIYFVLSVDIHVVHPLKNEPHSASDTHTCIFCMEDPCYYSVYDISNMYNGHSVYLNNVLI